MRTSENDQIQNLHYIFHFVKSKAIESVHSSEKEVFGQLKDQEKCFKICYVYGKRKSM